MGGRVRCVEMGFPVEIVGESALHLSRCKALWMLEWGAGFDVLKWDFRSKSLAKCLAPEALPLSFAHTPGGSL